MYYLSIFHRVLHICKVMELRSYGITKYSGVTLQYPNVVLAFSGYITTFGINRRSSVLIMDPLVPKTRKRMLGGPAEEWQAGDAAYRGR